MIAGLLNILAVYDACCGPAVVPAKGDEEDEPKRDGKQDNQDDEEDQS